MFKFYFAWIRVLAASIDRLDVSFLISKLGLLYKHRVSILTWVVR